ncbi:MAG: transposase [Lewinellaceae bacterium]|nr:transposase [Lewinellaceae bacterium]
MSKQEAIEKAIYHYNHSRPHASCDYHTPVNAHQLQKPQKTLET